MTVLRDRVKEAIRQLYLSQLPKDIHNNMIGTVVHDNLDGTFDVETSDGNHRQVTPIYPIAVGEQVMVISTDKAMDQAVPLVPKPQTNKIIHPPYFSGGKQRFAVFQTNSGALPLPASYIDGSRVPNLGSGRAVDFQDANSANVFRLEFPDLDSTWNFVGINAPGTTIGSSSTGSGFFYFNYHINTGSGLSGETGISGAFSSDGRAFVVALMQQEPGWSGLPPVPSYQYKIRMYNLGEALTAVPNTPPLDATNNLFQIQANLIAEHTLTCNLAFELPTYLGSLTTCTYFEHIFPYSFLVNKRDDGKGYTCYWLDSYDISVFTANTNPRGISNSPSNLFMGDVTPQWGFVIDVPGTPPTGHPVDGTYAQGYATHLAYVNSLDSYSGTNSRISNFLINYKGGVNNGTYSLDTVARAVPFQLIHVKNDLSEVWCIGILPSSPVLPGDDFPTPNAIRSDSLGSIAIFDMKEPDPSYQLFPDGILPGYGDQLFIARMDASSSVSGDRIIFVENFVPYSVNSRLTFVQLLTNSTYSALRCYFTDNTVLTPYPNNLQYQKVIVLNKGLKSAPHAKANLFTDGLTDPLLDPKDPVVAKFEGTSFDTMLALVNVGYNATPANYWQYGIMNYALNKNTGTVDPASNGKFGTLIPITKVTDPSADPNLKYWVKPALWNVGLSLQYGWPGILMYAER